MTNNPSLPPPTYLVRDRGLTFNNLSKSVIAQQVAASQLSDGAQVCEVGASAWLPVRIAFPELVHAPAPHGIIQDPPFVAAGLVDRAWAFILDGFIAGIPLSIFFAVGSIVSAGIGDSHPSFGGVLWFSIVGITGGLWAAYPIYFLASPRQATFGMSVMRLRLVMKNGDRPDLKVTSERTTFAIFVSSFCAAGFIWAIFDRQHRTLQDVVSGTKVIKVSEETM